MKMKFVHHFVSLSRSFDRFVFISLQNAIEMTFSFFFFFPDYTTSLFRIECIVAL